MPETITVTARPWAHGWELIIDAENATQVRSLSRAADQVRAYLDTIDPETDHSQTGIHLVPEDTSARQSITDAAQARTTAEAAEAEAARRSRAAVAALRQDHGYSITDAAALMGISRTRLIQLNRDTASA